MVRIIKDNKQVDLKKLSNLYPLCRYLVKIDDFSSTEGIVLAVSDSVDTDNEIANMMHEYLNKNTLLLAAATMFIMVSNMLLEALGSDRYCTLCLDPGDGVRGGSILFQVQNTCVLYYTNNDILIVGRASVGSMPKPGYYEMLAYSDNKEDYPELSKMARKEKNATYIKSMISEGVTALD